MYIPCIFQTKHSLVDDNAWLAVLGDCPVLGQWTPKKALVGERKGEDGLHEVVAMLPVNTVCHFKWCIIDKGIPVYANSLDPDPNYLRLDYHIKYWGSLKQSAFRVKDHMMYIQSPWNKELSVISIPDLPVSSLGNKTMIVFQMSRSEDTSSGQLFLVGNHRALGSWLVNDGKQADSCGRVTAYLPVGERIQFKWMMKYTDHDEEAHWEDGADRTYTVEDRTLTVIECNWGGPQTYWTCNQPDIEVSCMCISSGLRPRHVLPTDSSGKGLDENNKVAIFGYRPTLQHCLYVGIVAAVGYGLYMRR